MRFNRLLLLVALVAGIAGVMASSASALAFEDTVCPYIPGTLIKACPNGTVGKAYSQQLQGRNGTGCVPYVTWKANGALPPGLTLSSSGLISGTPTQGGQWTFWVIMQDIPNTQGGVSWCADNKSTEGQFSITVLQGLQIQQRQSALTAAQTNTPYSMQFTASGASSASWTVSSGALPAGLTLSSTGLLSGTPTATGDFTFQVTASNGSATDTQTYSLSVVEPLKINNAPGGVAGEVGLAFNLAPNGSGGKQAYTWALTGTLPTGLTFDPATGAITGKPTTPGTFPISLGLTDSIGLTQTANIRLVVVSHVLVTKLPFATAHVGKRYSAKLSATGGVRPLTWNILGGRPGIVPPGLRFNKRTGVFSGIPRKAGTYRLRMQVVDKLGVKSAVGIVLSVK
jgi:hypothetical protein